MAKTPTRRPFDWSHRHWSLRPLWLRSFSRRHRWLIRIVLGVFVLPCIALLILTRSPLTRILVDSRLGSVLNLDVDADSVYVRTNGTLIMDRARFRLPGVAGGAGQFLNVDRIEATVNWWSLLTGSPRIRHVDMEQPVLTVSQSVSDGSLNIGALVLPASGGKMAVPPIQLHNAAVEIDENDGGRIFPLRRVQVDGFFRPSTTEPGAYQFRLQENAQRRRPEPGAQNPAPRPSTQPGFLVNGSLASNGDLTVQIENFALDDWPADNVPRPSRARFADLGLKGNVPRAWVRYTRGGGGGGGVSARLELDGVGMNLPLELTNYAAGVEGVQGPFPRFLRMSDVSGAITFAPDGIQAKVKGLLEDLPYDVTLDYRGLSENSPFTCDFKSEGFVVEHNPSLLPYAPAEVRRWLKMFSSPTAVVNTTMTVARAEPRGNAPGDITVAGDVFLSQGAAAFERFPYEFRDMSGHFHFTSNEVSIVSVTGTSPSGATIHAHGLIAPLDDTSEVTVDVQVSGAPIDDAMRKAFGPQRGQVINALFNQDRFDELVKAGLIVPRDAAVHASEEIETHRRALASATPTHADELKAKIADLQRTLNAPIFDLGGSADVAVRVHSPRGKNQPYLTTIDVTLPRAGLLPEAFPLPIEASGVKVHIENSSGRLIAGDFRAIGGGQATVDATFTIPGDDAPDVRPTIDVQVRDLPLTGLLIHALPAGEPPETQAGAGQSPSVKRILRDLHLSGRGEGTLHIAPRDAKGDDNIGFDANFSVTGAACEPDPRAQRAMRIADIAGRIRASEQALDVTLTGAALAITQGAAQPCALGPVATHVTAAFTPPAPAAPSAPQYHADITCPGLSLEAPVESLVGVFSATAADQIEQLRTTYLPRGAADISASVSSAGRNTQASVDLVPSGELSAALLGGRLALVAPTGHARVAIADGVSLACDNFAAVANFSDRPAGRVSVSGQYQFHPAAAPADLNIAWREAPLESPLLASIVRRRFGASLADAFDAAAPRGTFDADLALRPPADQDKDPQISGRVTPHSLAFTRHDVHVEFPDVTGVVEFDPGARSGTIRQLSGHAPRWSASVDGAWHTLPDGVLAARTQITGRADKLTPDLRASLPDELRSVLHDLSLNVEGPITLEDATLDLGRAADDTQSWTRFDGGITFSAAALDVGVPITDLSGRLDGAYRQDPARPPQFHADLGADSFKVGGVALGRSTATIQSGTRPGQVVVPMFAGECYGGRFAAAASVEPPLPGVGGASREYHASLQVAGARFHPLLQDMTAAAPDPADPDGHSDETGDLSRGELEAELTLAGVTNHPDQRSGRGTFRVSGGRVLNVPFMTRMIEVSNLALPTNARLDYAAGDFYIDGGLITFNDLALHSKSIAMLGYGTMTWPGKLLDLRFNSRSERPIPVLSSLIQGVRDELLTTTITGRLGEPEVHLQQFPGTRRMLGRAVGSTQSEDARRMARIENRSRDPGIRPSPPGIQPRTPEQSSAATPTEDSPTQPN